MGLVLISGFLPLAKQQQTRKQYSCLSKPVYVTILNQHQSEPINLLENQSMYAMSICSGRLGSIQIGY